ncbi:MAG: hypothetical protein J6U15_00825, partial [Lachnospiraceae bacterium]|nr:hypothetical protein [Lachnospiraceae bacterium]
MRRKLLSITMAAILGAGVLAGCSTTTVDSSSTAEVKETATETTETAEVAESSETTLTGEGSESLHVFLYMQ